MASSPLTILMIAAATPSAATAATAAPFSGLAKVIDGDSLMVGNTEVRLFGIDAPEFTQNCTRNNNPWPCGSVAADQLSKKLAGQQVSCSSKGRDQHGRTVARCTVGITELNRYMVANGYAVAYRRYSFDYNSAEESAKANKLGIWSGSFDLPSEVRQTGDDYRNDRVPAEAGTLAVQSFNSRPDSRTSRQRSVSGCNIKGNHSRKGEWIYHLPGMPYYSQTRAEEMFCSEADAKAAGYRRSKADRHR